MTPEEQITERINDYTRHLSDFYFHGKKLEYSATDFTKKILSIKVPKKVAECPECNRDDCDDCNGTGSITQEFTIKELIEGDVK